MYKDWIDEHYPDKKSAMLQCKEATKLMAEEFPELRRVRGNVMVGVDYRPHWWLVATDGSIVDPTYRQFTNISFYEEHDESMGDSHGKCRRCGELLYRSKGDDSYLCRECLPLTSS